MNTSEIGVIGDGVIGLFTAYYLAKSGVEVTVITKAPEGGDNCSMGNAGMIVPSHFIPLAAPGVIEQGMKWMFNRESPLYVSPSLSLKRLKWLKSFYASCTAANVEGSKQLLLDMNLKSYVLYQELASELGGFELEKKGLMMLSQTEKYHASEVKLAEEATKMGLEVDILGADQIAQMEEGLGAKVYGGVHYLSDSHLNPGKLMQQLRSKLSSLGVHFKYNFDVSGIVSLGSSKMIYNREKEGLSFEKLVICGGAWSGKIAGFISAYLPMQAGKGYSMTLEKIPLQLNTPSILTEAKVALSPWENKLRVSGTMEISNPNHKVDMKRVEGIKKATLRYFSNFQPQWYEGVDVWAGLRPLSPDGVPFIGEIQKNIWVNTGHAMMGISLAPSSGWMTANAITSKLVIPVRLNPLRF